MSDQTDKARAKYHRLKGRADKKRHRDKAAQRKRRKAQRSVWEDAKREHITGGMAAYHQSTPRADRFPPGTKKRNLWPA